MAGGLVAEMELPDRALRREILRDKASTRRRRLPDDCLELLVDGVRGSVRDLEGASDPARGGRGAARAARIDRELTEAALRQLGEPARDGPQDPRGGDRLRQRLLRREPTQLASRTRGRAPELPRQLAMYLCRRYTDASLSEIGRVFGRNHPSVANAIQRTERAILERAPLRYQVEELAARLEGRSGERGSGGRGRAEEREAAPDPAPRGSDAGR